MADPRWEDARETALARDGRQCVACSATERLQVHHLRPRSTGGAEYALENLTTLCRSCHQDLHAGESDPVVTFAESGGDIAWDAIDESGAFSVPRSGLGAAETVELVPFAAARVELARAAWRATRNLDRIARTVGIRSAEDVKILLMVGAWSDDELVARVFPDPVLAYALYVSPVGIDEAPQR
jgi:hypothetical protein